MESTRGTHGAFFVRHSALSGTFLMMPRADRSPPNSKWVSSSSLSIKLIWADQRRKSAIVFRVRLRSREGVV